MKDIVPFKLNDVLIMQTWEIAEFVGIIKINEYNKMLINQI